MNLNTIRHSAFSGRFVPLSVAGNMYFDDYVAMKSLPKFFNSLNVV